MQRALMHYFKPCNRELVLKALKKAGREDLIGWGGDCLIPPYERKPKAKDEKRSDPPRRAEARPARHGENHPPKRPRKGGRNDDRGNKRASERGRRR